MKATYSLSALLMGFALFMFLSFSASDFNPMDFGLGENTTSKTGVFYSDTVSAFPENIRPIERTFKKFREEGKKVALLIGASQVHAINKIKSGDKLCIEHLNDSPSAGNIGYLQVSTPNANFHDQFIIYKILRDRNINPDYMLLAFVYDDLREYPIQPQLLGLVSKFDSAEIRLCAQVVREITTEKNEIEAAKHKDAMARNATLNTPQEQLENFLVEKLEKYLPGYRYRNNLVAHLDVLYTLNLNGLVSNTIGALSRTSKVRYPNIPKDILEWNSVALKSLVNLAKNDGCRVIIYRQPIRPTDEDFYHDRDQYDSYFKSLAEEYAEDSLVQVADFEACVPQQYWGTTNLGEPDVFHFTQEGHRRLARLVDSLMILQIP